MKYISWWSGKSETKLKIAYIMVTIAELNWPKEEECFNYNLQNKHLLLIWEMKLDPIVCCKRFFFLS